jgi:hypothetical protein
MNLIKLKSLDDHKRESILDKMADVQAEISKWEKLEQQPNLKKNTKSMKVIKNRIYFNKKKYSDLQDGLLSIKS